MRDSLEAAAYAAKFVADRLGRKPEVALILGSGLGEFAETLSDANVLNTKDIPHYPPSTVPGHAGRLVAGVLRGNDRQSGSLLVFQGRTHFYESGRLDDVLFPARLALALGVTTLFVTNAAGGISRSLRPGDLMLIRDTINLTFLRVPVPPDARRTGPPDICHPHLRQAITESAAREKIPLKEGVYCWVKGPSYETAAEIDMLATIGGDAVGMSTVPELLLAAHSGVRTAGISLISNFATGRGGGILSHEEVTQTASRVTATFVRLLTTTLLSLTSRPA